MKIAITQRVIDFRNGPYDSIDHGFYSMFDGHELIPIPNNIKHFKSNIIQEADLVVFSGGNSMVYSDWQYNETRIKIEKHTLDLALLHNKPILGISRGTQFLTISYGGDISPHEDHKKDHFVEYKGEKYNVCSRHNEVLTSIPSGATILATDETGNVESWKLDNIACVLWHPERMADHWMPEEVLTVTKL
jgi:gamma-glutamyl-gamma-aminobutyrate hydrolase PuuD